MDDTAFLATSLARSIAEVLGDRFTADDAAVGMHDKYHSLPILNQLFDNLGNG